MIGTNAWGANAPINYLVAKQLWNAQLDVSATLDEWLQRAYGAGWKHMRQMHDELDARMLAHKKVQSPIYNGGQYEANEPVMKAIYAPLFASIEQHYRDTLAQCATDRQRQRLAMLGDNLIQLHHALRKAELIADDPKSIFHRNDTTFAKFLTDMEATMSLYYDSQGLDHGPIWKDQYGGL